MSPKHTIEPGATPPFDAPVCPGGYTWWYLDGVSDDGTLGFTIIMFVGSVFSPRYARARASQRRGGGQVHADPQQHCAVNVALYDLGRGSARAFEGRSWVMSEHGVFARESEQLRVGASSMRWCDEGRELLVELDERRTRFFGRRGPPLRGRVRLRPSVRFGPRVELDRWRPQPRHRWYPVAPHARVEVELDEPALRFSGSGYHDVNEGDEGLEQAFDSWNWSRSELGDETVILYDVVDTQRRSHARAWRFVPASATCEELARTEIGPSFALPRTRWGLEREIRSDSGHPPTLLHTLEDTPFYSRNLVRTRIGGREATAVHESLSLRRFAAPWVRFLLPFKMRRE